jgi:hypothetical protein
MYTLRERKAPKRGAVEAGATRVGRWAPACSSLKRSGQGLREREFSLPVAFTGGRVQRKCSACDGLDETLVQPKFVVGPANDALEREADEVADRVMRMGHGAPLGSAPAAIQRAGAACENEQATSIPSVRLRHGPGEPLPQATRGFFEPRFGHDFSRVRVHADAAAADAARAVRARAYTIGSHIVFDRGQYAPATAEGKRLLAHELTHVVQQGAHATAPLVLQRTPDGQSLSEAADPINEEDHPDHAWHHVLTAGSRGAPPFAVIRSVTAQNLDLDWDLLAATTAKFHYRAGSLGPGGKMRPSYFAYRHPTEGVVLRAMAVLQGYHPQRRPPGRDLANETFQYEFYVFSRHPSKDGGHYASPLSLSSAPPLPTSGVESAETPSPDQPAPYVPRAVTGTWLELHESVFAFLPDPGLTLERIAEYLAGHPDVPEMLAQLNAFPRNQVIPPAQPVIIPIEFIDKRDAIADMPADVRERIRSTREAQANNAAHRRFIKAKGGHPLGPGAVGLVPLTTETLKQTANLLARFGEGVAYAIAFVAGLVQGFLGSIWDAVSGIAELIYSIVKSIVTFEFISDVKDLANSIKNLKGSEIMEAVGKWAADWDEKLKSDNAWVAGRAHGYLTGYVMAEALMLLVSFGSVQAAKAALWTSKLGKMVKGARVVKRLEKAFETGAEFRRAAGDKFEKAAEALRHSRYGGAVKAAEATAAAFAWTADAVARVLRLPGDISVYVAEKVVAHARQLEPFFNRIRELSERAKRWLFGCHSPCEWHPDAVVRTMDRLSNAEIERLVATPATKFTVRARQSVATLDASLETRRLELEAARKTLLAAEDDLGAARQLAGDKAADIYAKETQHANAARQQLKTAEENYNLAKSEADAAAVAGRRVEWQERQVADIDREIQEIYRRNNGVRPTLDKPDGRRLRDLDDDRRRMAARLEENVDMLGGWVKALRQGTPGPGAAEKALANLDDLPKELRTADGLHPIDITDRAGGRLIVVSPDHIYPFDKIIRDPRFLQLKPSQRRELLEIQKNYMPLSRSANSSKGDLTMDEWFKTRMGSQVPLPLRQPLRDVEKKAQQAVSEHLDKLLNEK